MNRNQRRASMKNGKRLQALEWNPFEDVTEQARQRHLLLNSRPGRLPDQIWLNNRFSVQCYRGERQLGHRVTRAMIRRNDAEPIYSWSDLQRLKNEIFGESARAFQMFPAQDELVDVANMYWLWVIED